MQRNLFARMLLSLVLVVGIVAPFTFLVPNNNVAIVTISSVVKKDNVIEKPLHRVNLPDFSAISDIPTKKRLFFDFLRPAIEAKNNQLAADRKRIKHWQSQIVLGNDLNSEDQASLQALFNTYRINNTAVTAQNIYKLLERVDTIPTSLILVQAANESAWGTSRFARIGLNFFGIWCYKKGCGMVPNGRITGDKHEVTAFKSVDAAVSNYFKNINTNNAYQSLRDIRTELNIQGKPYDAALLANGLLLYSARGTHYIKEIKDMLRQNKRYFIKPSNL